MCVMHYSAQCIALLHVYDPNHTCAEAGPTHLNNILNAKNLASLSISIFFWFKTDFFKLKCYSDDVPVSKDYFCHKFECLCMPGNSKALFW